MLRHLTLYNDFNHFINGKLVNFHAVLKDKGPPCISTPAGSLSLFIQSGGELPHDCWTSFSINVFADTGIGDALCLLRHFAELI